MIYIYIYIYIYMWVVWPKYTSGVGIQDNLVHFIHFLVYYNPL